MEPNKRKGKSHPIRFRVIYHFGKWLAFLVVISQLTLPVEAAFTIIGNDKASFIEASWAGADNSDHYELPTDFETTLLNLNSEVTGNGVWVEESTSFRRVEYIFGFPEFEEYCDITYVKVIIKYFAQGASSFVVPCKDGPGESEFCYLENPSTIAWKTDEFEILGLNEIKIDMMLTVGGFIMFDSVTIEHDGNDCVTTTVEPTTTTGGTTESDPTDGTTDWDWDPTDDSTDWDLTESTTDWDATESTTDWDPTDSTTDFETTESTTPDGSTTWETTDGSTVTHDPEGTAGTWIPVPSTETTSEPSTVSTELPSTPTNDPTASTPTTEPGEVAEPTEWSTTEESTTPSTTEETTSLSTTEETETTPPSTTEESTPPSSSETVPPSTTEESITEESTTEEFSTEEPTTEVYTSSTQESSTTTEDMTVEPTFPTWVPPPTTKVPPITGFPTTEYPTTTPAAEDDDGGLSTKEVLLFIILPIVVTIGLVAFLASVFYFGLRKNPIGGVKRWFRKGSTGGPRRSQRDTNANVSPDQERALTGSSYPVHQAGMQPAQPTMLSNPPTNFGNAPPPPQIPAMSSPIYTTPDTRMMQDEPRVGRSRAPSTMYTGEYSRPEQPGNLQLPRIRRKLD